GRRLVRTLPGPGDGGGWEIDGVDLEAEGGEVQRVAARSAAQIEGAARGDEAAVEVRHQVLVRLRHEEGNGLGAVRVEAVPPGTGVRAPAIGLGSEQSVEELEDVLQRAYGAVHSLPFPVVPGTLGPGQTSR